MEGGEGKMADRKERRETLSEQVVGDWSAVQRAYWTEGKTPVDSREPSQVVKDWSPAQASGKSKK